MIERNVPAETMNPNEIDEFKALTRFLEVLGNGVVRPYDSSFVAEKLTHLEAKLGEDFSELKKCCPQESTIREALLYKKYIEATLRRIEQITKIEVRKHNYE